MYWLYIKACVYIYIYIYVYVSVYVSMCASVYYTCTCIGYRLALWGSGELGCFGLRQLGRGRSS